MKKDPKKHPFLCLLKILPLRTKATASPSPQATEAEHAHKALTQTVFHLQQNPNPGIGNVHE